MMRIDDEIKKGLACCAASIYQCADDCPYRDECRNGRGGKAMMEDALALLQQLESDKQQLEGLLAHMNQLRDAAAGRALKMEERVHQLEAERDAAVRDLTEMAQDTDESCEYCEMFKTTHCSLECRMKNKGFKWRGVQKEE